MSYALGYIRFPLLFTFALAFHYLHSVLRCNIFRPQKEKNWSELIARSTKFARGCLNESGTCASVFGVVKFHNASERVISKTHTRSPVLRTTFRLGVPLRMLVQ